ncbi:hypothetical protein GOV11_03625 [Candidatus Woesearchaeota archaeon]|nr:hypothetical protein [Candidatus Woesearchaeota archaeon]
MKRDIPLAFSEITHLEKQAKRNNSELEPLNAFYPAVNDAVMKVFETWNQAQSYSSRRDGFAKELDMRIDPAFKFHTRNLADLLEELPSRAKKAKEALSHYKQASRRLGPVNGLFNRSWSHSTWDNTHTECSTNSEGDTDCWTVCDSTDHTFTYRNQYGEAASKELTKTLKAQPVVEYSESFIIAKKTEADGEYAAEKSRRKTEYIKAGEALIYANSWYQVNVFNTNNPGIEHGWKHLHKDNKDWAKAKGTARSRSYNTMCGMSHPGPAEYQVADGALRTGTSVKNGIDRILEGLDYVESQAPVLRQKTDELIGIVLDGEEGSTRKTSREVLGIANKMYQKNFPAGWNTAAVRPSVMAMGILLGCAIGSLAGAGIDYGGKRFGWWNTNW